MGFYDTYLKILNSKVNCEAKLSVPELAESGFRKMLTETQAKNYELVTLLAQSLKNCLNKPQRLIHDDEDYYIACDMHTNTYYVCYKSLMMIDIDYYKNNNIDNIRSECIRDNSKLFRIYKSRNGIHAFLISHSSTYTDPNAINLMLDLDCDFYYTVYSYLRGWSVRLNRKETDVSDELYNFIEDIGTGKPDERLEKLVNLHINLVPVFKDTSPNTMFGA